MRTFERRSRGFRVALVLVLAGITVACGSASSTILSTIGGPVDNGGAAVPQAAAPSAAPAAGGDASGQSAASPGAVPDGLKIVYTGSLQMVVADLQPALAQARAAVAAAGGYIGASQESNNGDRPAATITYRIPASRWEDTRGALRALATKVVAEQTQATEVGGQIVDLEARIANLRASEAALQEIAKNSAKVSDLLEVQAQLTDVRGQIEQLDGQRSLLVDQVAYGTLVTTFGLEVAAVKEAAKGWDPGKDVDSATATLIGIGQAFVSGAIWFGIVWLPFLLLLVVIAFVARRLFRRYGPKPGGPGTGPTGAIPGWGGQG
jgi:Domain of unknown function (DUF4349)